MLWDVVIFCQDDTPWDGGTFKLSLQFSEDYPNKPPTVRFSFLCDPNPNSPANSEVARMFSDNKRDYNRKVCEFIEQSWTTD
ncbi:hypothetical protein MKW92_035731 [Papaver armeniacum]|nr:hypothetical protein MKW92_035731 [Papaver armeniacum]